MFADVKFIDQGVPWLVPASYPDCGGEPWWSNVKLVMSDVQLLFPIGSGNSVPQEVASQESAKEVVAPMGRKGRAPAFDWDRLTAAIEVEIATKGPVELDGLKGWRTQADAVRWAEHWLDGQGVKVSESTLKHYVARILSEVNGQKVGN